MTEDRMMAALASLPIGRTAEEITAAFAVLNGLYDHLRESGAIPDNETYAHVSAVALADCACCIDVGSDTVTVKRDSLALSA